MNIEIDQSGKIEATQHDTIIAFSNHIVRTILISRKEKRAVQAIFREIGKPRIFMVKLFALLVFLLVKGYLSEIDRIVIDREYPGQEHLIKDYLLKEIRKVKAGFETDRIIFLSVGKKSGSHLAASAVAHGKKHPDIIVSAVDILRYIVR